MLFLLMLAQYTLEAYKWKRLMASAWNITLFQAYAAIFKGQAFAFITPHGMGDYYGRLLTIPTSVQSVAIASTLVSRWMQLVITLGVSIIVVPIYLLSISVAPIPVLHWYFIAAALGLGCIVVLWKMLPKLQSYSYGSSWAAYVLPVLVDIQLFSKKIILEVGVVSFFRYTLFASALGISFYFFDIHPPLAQLIMGIVLIYVAKSIFPTFLDLGIRELTAVYYFGSLGYDEPKILLAGILVWWIQVVVPALLGWLWLVVQRDKTQEEWN